MDAKAEEEEEAEEVEMLFPLLKVAKLTSQVLRTPLEEAPRMAAQEALGKIGVEATTLEEVPRWRARQDNPCRQMRETALEVVLAALET